MRKMMSLILGAGFLMAAVAAKADLTPTGGVVFPTPDLTKIANQISAQQTAVANFALTPWPTPDLTKIAAAISARETAVANYLLTPRPTLNPTYVTARETAVASFAAGTPWPTPDMTKVAAEISARQTLVATLGITPWPTPDLTKIAALKAKWSSLDADDIDVSPTAK